jgi:hypothetical protein
MKMSFDIPIQGSPILYEAFPLECGGNWKRLPLNEGRKCSILVPMRYMKLELGNH